MNASKGACFVKDQGDSHITWLGRKTVVYFEIEVDTEL